jgi:hypothetical protein
MLNMSSGIDRANRVPTTRRMWIAVVHTFPSQLGSVFLPPLNFMLLISSDTDTDTSYGVFQSLQG